MCTTCATLCANCTKTNPGADQSKAKSRPGEPIMARPDVPYFVLRRRVHLISSRLVSLSVCLSHFLSLSNTFSDRPSDCPAYLLSNSSHFNRRPPLQQWPSHISYTWTRRTRRVRFTLATTARPISHITMISEVGYVFARGCVLFLHPL